MHSSYVEIESVREGERVCMGPQFFQGAKLACSQRLAALDDAIYDKEHRFTQDMVVDLAKIHAHLSDMLMTFRQPVWTVTATIPPKYKKDAKEEKWAHVHLRPSHAPALCIVGRSQRPHCCCRTRNQKSSLSCAPNQNSRTFPGKRKVVWVVRVYHISFDHISFIRFLTS